MCKRRRLQCHVRRSCHINLLTTISAVRGSNWKRCDGGVHSERELSKFPEGTSLAPAPCVPLLRLQGYNALGLQCLPASHSEPTYNWNNACNQTTTHRQNTPLLDPNSTSHDNRTIYTSSQHPDTTLHESRSTRTHQLYKIKLQQSPQHTNAIGTTTSQHTKHNTKPTNRTSGECWGACLLRERSE